MLFGGLQKFSLLDYPDYLSAIIFTQGCNFYCQFCYNPMLVRPNRQGKFSDKKNKSPQGDKRKGHPNLREDDLFLFLKTRAGKLEAVVISGGEPTLQPDLVEFLAKIKKLGFLVKLDTNGSRPEVIAKLIKNKLVDYLAMDIKAPAKKYGKVTGKKVDFNKIKKSVKLIIMSKLPYEFRTTVVPGLINKDDLIKIGELITGADKWYLQQFKSNTPLVNQKLVGRKPYVLPEMEEMAEIVRKYVKKCEVR
jgi:pyruvate formate lyase activating enzyme